MDGRKEGCLPASGWVDGLGWLIKGRREGMMGRKHPACMVHSPRINERAMCACCTVFTLAFPLRTARRGK